MSTTTTTAPATMPATRRRTWRGLTVLAAAAGAAILWTVVDPVTGTRLSTGNGEQPVGLAAVIVTSVVAGLAGWGLLAVLERLVPRPRRVWTPIAVTVLVLSLLGPLGGGTDTASRLVLAGLHLIVGTVLVVGLPRR